MISVMLQQVIDQNDLNYKTNVHETAIDTKLHEKHKKINNCVDTPYTSLRQTHLTAILQLMLFPAQILIPLRRDYLTHTNYIS